MASAAKSIVDEENGEVAHLNKRIRLIEHEMSAMKKFVREALLQMENTTGVGSEIKSDKSKTETKPKENGRTGREEVGIKRLTEAEFKYRMNMSLCVRCDKKYYKNHKRKCKKKHLRLQIVKEGEGEEKKRGHQSKFLGKIGDREVIVLVGLAATRNFISRTLVNALGIPLQKTMRFRVKFGSDEDDKAEGEEVCEGKEIVEEFFPIDLGIADVVLGNEWVRSLGEATFHGFPMTLTFKWHGRTV